jgi:cytoplasmic iron level regulating protein YaaA (DUF328/UPF0246 family)
MQMMKVSEKIAELNKKRFNSFSFPLTKNNSKQALLMFKGDVYKDIDVENYNKENFKFAQKTVRILSGLYGVLKPLDLIQPYRLEMHLKVKYWKDKVTKYFLDELRTDEVIVNLASEEYFSALDIKEIKNRVVKVSFKERKDDQYKIVAIYAKRARGTMTNYIIKNKIENINDLKKFNLNNYSYNEQLSSENEFIFVR